MSIVRCDKHDRAYDSDYTENCPACEAGWTSEWEQWESEQDDEFNAAMGEVNNADER